MGRPQPRQRIGATKARDSGNSFAPLRMNPRQNSQNSKCNGYLPRTGENKVKGFVTSFGLLGVTVWLVNPRLKELASYPLIRSLAILLLLVLFNWLPDRCILHTHVHGCEVPLLM